MVYIDESIVEVHIAAKSLLKYCSSITIPKSGLMERSSWALFQLLHEGGLLYWILLYIIRSAQSKFVPSLQHYNIQHYITTARFSFNPEGTKKKKGDWDFLSSPDQTWHRRNALTKATFAATWCCNVHQKNLSCQQNASCNILRDFWPFFFPTAGRVAHPHCPICHYTCLRV